MADYMDTYTITQALRDMLCEGGHYGAGDIRIEDNYISKDHGNYIEVNVKTSAGHDSVDVYMEGGRIVKMIPHDHNTVLTKAYYIR